MCFHRSAGPTATLRLEQSRDYTGTGPDEYTEAPQRPKTPLTRESEPSDVSHFHECNTLPAWACVRMCVCQLFLSVLLLQLLQLLTLCRFLNENIFNCYFFAVYCVIKTHLKCIWPILLALDSCTFALYFNLIENKKLRLSYIWRRQRSEAVLRLQETQERRGCSSHLAPAGPLSLLWWCWSWPPTPRKKPSHGCWAGSETSSPAEVRWLAWPAETHQRLTLALPQELIWWWSSWDPGSEVRTRTTPTSSWWGPQGSGSSQGLRRWGSLRSTTTAPWEASPVLTNTTSPSLQVNSACCCWLILASAVSF